MSTAWSNNNAKTTGAWTPATKQRSRYTDNIIKSRTLFTPVTKQNTNWDNEAVVGVPWLYDDATQKYDDTPVRGYDTLVPTTNNLNGKLPTVWEEGA